MAAANIFQFVVIRYMPDVVRGEFANIGVIVYASDFPEEAARVQLTRDWRLVLTLDPDADTEMLSSLEEDLKKLVNAPESCPESIVRLLQDQWSNTLQLHRPASVDGLHGSPIGARVGGQLDEILSVLFRMYVQKAEMPNGSF